MTDTPDDLDLLASEYALGVLGLEERAAAEARLRRDPAFAAAVVAWEQRLSGLNDDFDAVPPPDLMPAIEARLFPQPARPRRSWLRMLPRFVIGAGVAMGLAVGVVMMLPPPSPRLGTTLTAEADPLRFEATWASGTLTLTRVAGAAAEPGRVHELWLIVGEAAPVSLGLLTEASFRTALPTLAPGMVLAVTLEPAGGAPGGVASGPVVAVGKITNL